MKTPFYAAAALALLGACGGSRGSGVARAPAPLEPGDRASAPFRAEHAHILGRLDETEAHAAALTTAGEDDIGPHVDAIVRFFREELLPHAEAEEHVLYAVADRVAATPAPYRWTDSLRYEHTVVGAAIEEMAAFQRGEDRSPDALASFARLVIRTIGLIRGHFGAEENVLLEALDRSMTREQFEREVIEPTRAYVREHGGAEHAH